MFTSEPGLALLGKVDEQMIEVTPVYDPSTSGRAEQAFISKVSTTLMPHL